MRTPERALFVLSLAWLALAPTARAHEVRPAYLGIEEIGPGRYELLWRTPVLSGMRLPVALELPGRRARRRASRRGRSCGLAARAPDDRRGRGGLGGRRIEFVGLQATITDVLVRVQLLDGTHSTTLVRPSQPWLEIAARAGRWRWRGAYVLHGVEHILLGFDHLLFVLGLILIVPSLRVLLLTITAFTVAHSITLALATLGVVHVPGPPVEAMIALSILLLASEILRVQRGEAAQTARRPWLVAFALRPAARLRLRERAHRRRAARGRGSARARLLQRRRRGGAARLHRRGAPAAGRRQADPEARGASTATRCGPRLRDRHPGGLLVLRARGGLRD